MRLARTAAQLRPDQVGQRARLRAQRLALDHGCRWPAAGCWPVPTRPRRPAGRPRSRRSTRAVWRRLAGRAALLAGELSLLGVTRVLAPAGAAAPPTGRPRTGTMAGAPLLWRFHLYYWDWAWGLAAGGSARRRGRCSPDLWESWHAAVRPGRGPAWRRTRRRCAPGRSAGSTAPWSGRPGRGPFLARARRARRLPAPQPGNRRRRQPPDQEPEGAGRAGGVLRRRRAAAPHAAGGCAASWPCRCCRTAATTSARPPITARCSATSSTSPGCCARRAGTSRPDWPRRSPRCARWLGAVLTPAGDVPLLNDGFPVSRELLAALAAGRAARRRPLHVLPDTGLARATAGGWHLLADIGPPCPRELPAHAHADTLGCLVHVDGEPLLIDTGTSSYAAGAVRDHERSTAAHNTLEVDGRTPPRSGGRSGRAAGPGSAASRPRGAARGHGDGRGRPRRLPEPARPATCTTAAGCCARTSCGSTTP